MGADPVVYQSALVSIRDNDDRRELERLLSEFPELLAEPRPMMPEVRLRFPLLLNVATICDRLECMHVLINHGANVNRLDRQAALHEARSIHAVRILVAAGANINMPDGVDGSTPLHTAAHRGLLDVVDELVRLGADVNATFDLGNALHAAIGARGGRDDPAAVVQKLLDLGCHTSVKNPANGYLPIHFAIAVGNYYAVEALLKAGASTDVEDVGGKSLLGFAYEYPGTYELLIMHGLKPREDEVAHEQLTNSRTVSICCHPDRPEAVVMCPPCLLGRSDLDSNTPRRAARLERADEFCVEPLGSNQFALSGLPHVVEFRDWGDWQRQGSIVFPEGGDVACMKLAPNHASLGIATIGHVYTFDLNTREISADIEVETPLRISFSPDSSLLAICLDEQGGGTVQIVLLSPGGKHKVVDEICDSRSKRSNRAFYAAVFDPSGETLVTWCGRHLECFRLPLDEYQSCDDLFDFDMDDPEADLHTETKATSVWHVPFPEFKGSRESHWPGDLLFRGGEIIWARSGHTTCVLDPATGKVLRELPAIKGMVYQLALDAKNRVWAATSKGLVQIKL